MYAKQKYDNHCLHIFYRQIYCVSSKMKKNGAYNDHEHRQRRRLQHQKVKSSCDIVSTSDETIDLN